MKKVMLVLSVVFFGGLKAVPENETDGMEVNVEKKVLTKKMSPTFARLHSSEKRVTDSRYKKLPRGSSEKRAGLSIVAYSGHQRTPTEKIPSFHELLPHEVDAQ